MCIRDRITETRHFGVLLEIPRIQIKGLIKPDKLPGGRWVYEAFANLSLIHI